MRTLKQNRHFHLASVDLKHKSFQLKYGFQACYHACRKWRCLFCSRTCFLLLIFNYRRSTRVGRGQIIRNRASIISTSQENNIFNFSLCSLWNKYKLICKQTHTHTQNLSLRKTRREDLSLYPHKATIYFTGQCLCSQIEHLKKSVNKKGNNQRTSWDSSFSFILDASRPLSIR